eukprot:SAG25_NODE_1021_length_4261_cov_5.098624_6_plen_150_part_01
MTTSADAGDATIVSGKEGGRRLAVVIKRSMNHCYTLRPEPSVDTAHANGWATNAVPGWVAAWNAGLLAAHPLQRALAPRLVACGGEEARGSMLAAANGAMRVQEAVMAASLDRAEVRLHALRSVEDWCAAATGRQTTHGGAGALVAWLHG